jgi:hypothetical protein
MVPRQDVARAQAQGFRVALKREVPDEAVLWEIDRALLEVDQRAREQAEEEKARKLVVFDEKLAASDEKLATARQELAAARQELAAAEAKAGEPGDLVWAVFLGLVRGATLDLMDIGMRLFAEASYRMTVELRATHPGAAAIGTIVGVIALVFVVFRSRLTRWSFGRAVRKSLGRDLTVEELQDLDHVVRGWERGVVWLKCGGGCRGGGG